MATYKTYSNDAFSPIDTHLKCDICGSADIVDTTEGYVCRECGIVLEIQKLQYNRPYNEEKVQYAQCKGITQIGTNRERSVSPFSEQLNRLNKQNSIIPNDQAIIESAEVEISRIFSELNLSEFESLKMMVLNKFKEVRPKLRKGVKFRNTDKLVSIIIYFCLKLRNISIKAIDLINASKITKKEFNDFCLQVRKFIPEYLERNRQEYILNRVFEVSQHFDLGMDFFHLARKILKKLWHGIKDTTDDALAGLVCSISLLCSHNGEITVSALCNRLGIRMSTIQAQVKKKIFDKFRVEGFISLIKSADLLVHVMEKLGIFEEDSVKTKEIEEDASELVEIDVGNASRVFNAIDNVKYYYSYFVVKGKDNTLVFINLAIYQFDESYKKPEKAQGEAFLDFLLYRFPLPTGPPQGKA
jgi:transcription initiation factor TFIIIB Brf1 subunit/transcription initiation factor TFIIB